jgi:hypothetical protein
MSTTIPTLEEVKTLVFQLPTSQLMELSDEITSRIQTLEMMKLAETGFQEWFDSDEDIYDDEA